MYVTVAKDGNNLTFPIAFAMVVENNMVSCTWFLMRLKECLGQGKEVAFISNMDDIIMFSLILIMVTPVRASTNIYVQRIGSGRSFETLY
uniref:MULE transposase domain-containing protein n=1 Tax=Lactuca sativa TaxID=4236 RepID=A0A9R1WM83_LACSA|nr:hypothetical protein LSAT_V11C900485850 [Lactuca sativa]